MKSSDNDNEQVIEVAAELQAADEAQREAQAERADLREAAKAVGIAEQYVEQAEQVVAERGRARSFRQTRTRRAMMLVGLGALGSLAAVLILVLRPAPGPFHETFDDDPGARWALRHNAESSAAHAFVEEADRGKVVSVSVTGLAPRASDGRFYVNLGSDEIPSTFSAFTKVRFAIRGEGLSVRLYLEAGDERWRSPPVQTREEWISKEIALTEFDFQERGASKHDWKRRPYKAPARVEEAVFKLGYFVNEPGQTGLAVIDDLEFL